MDKGKYLYETQQRAIALVRRRAGFDFTSSHPNWRGKVKCAHCNKQGYPPNPTASVQAHNDWWGNKHGIHCKKAPASYINTGTSAFYNATVTTGTITATGNFTIRTF